MFEMANSFPVDYVTIGYDNHTGNNLQIYNANKYIANFRVRSDRLAGEEASGK